MTLESGETADYSATKSGLMIEILDKYNTKLGFSWADIAPVVRALARQWETEPEQTEEVTETINNYIPVEITQSDIDNAICEWNDDLDSKLLVYEYMRENPRARETANYLREQYGGDLSEFTVTKDGAESVILSWAKVQQNNRYNDVGERRNGGLFGNKKRLDD